MKNKEKKIWIAGPGLGGMRLMTRQVSAVLKMAQLFIGSREVLETVRRYASENGARCVSAVRTAQVRRAVVEAEEERYYREFRSCPMRRHALALPVRMPCMRT